MWAIQKKRPSRRDENIPPLSWTDKRCLAALAALRLGVGLVEKTLDGNGAPASRPVDKPGMRVACL